MTILLEKKLISTFYCFFMKFRCLLRSEHIDVSYFAAGIVAHVASEGEAFWSCSSISWKEIVDELVRLTF